LYALRLQLKWALHKQICLSVFSDRSFSQNVSLPIDHHHDWRAPLIPIVFTTRSQTIMRLSSFRGFQFFLASLT
jgi:hypothetical protein